ncbi:MAG: protein-methionine-sulfoxide reductase catalytic subunit MsrP [Bacteroidia bacterium]
MSHTHDNIKLGDSLKRRQFLRQASLAGVGLMFGADVLGKGAIFSTNNQPNPEAWDKSDFARELGPYYELAHPGTIQTLQRKNWNAERWNIEVSGLSHKKGKYMLSDMVQSIGSEKRTMRIRGIERWSMEAEWTGFSLAALISKLKPASTATHVRFTSAMSPSDMVSDKDANLPAVYSEAIRLDEAMHTLAFVATGINGQALGAPNGGPVRLVLPWKYAHKSIMAINGIEFLDKEPTTFWQERNSDEYDFLGNVHPEQTHPRWSQQEEHRLFSNEHVDTLPFNGHQAQVAHLYV